MVCADLVGVIVAAAFVVTDAVKETDAFPAVPEETYPAETTGVTDTLFVSVSVLVPAETDADVPDIEDGDVADPLVTLLLAFEA